MNSRFTRKFSSANVFISLLVILGLWGIHNLFGGNFYTNHDGYMHTARIYQYFQALVDGQFPPRWAGTLNGGIGSPIFVYSYPLVYLFTSVLHIGGLSFVDAFKTLVGVGYVLSGVAMFGFLRMFFRDRAAFVGGVFYILAPYRFLNIYVRGSLSESFAYAILPFVFLAIAKLYRRGGSIWFGLTAVIFGVFLLSQYLVAAIFLPMIVLFVLLLDGSGKSLRFLLKSTLAGVFGFGLAAFMYVPIAFERQFVRFDEAISFYDTHFVNWFQLIRSPWGYGFSLPGVNDGMSFQIGLTHLLVVGLTGILLTFSFIRRKKMSSANTLKLSLVLLAFVFFAAATIVMIDWPVARYLWRHIAPLRIIDLPWRFLGLATFSASIIAAFLTDRIRHGVLIVALIILVVYANRNHIRVNKYISYPDEEFVFYRGNATWVNEYTPIWRGTTMFDEVERRYAYDADISVSPVVSRSNELTVRVDAREDAWLQLNILYFPGWRISLDGKTLMPNEGFSITSREGEGGLIAVPVSRGEQVISAKFGETGTRMIGNRISVLSGVLLPVAAFRLRKTKRDKTT